MSEKAGESAAARPEAGAETEVDEPGGRYAMRSGSDGDQSSCASGARTPPIQARCARSSRTTERSAEKMVTRRSQQNPS